MHKQFYRRKVVSPGLFTWREGSKASRLADAMGNGNFHIILFKTQMFFMIDKCFQKIKIHLMRSSGSHGIHRIKVMMAAFLAGYTPLSNCKQNVNKIHASLEDYRKRHKDKTTEQVSCFIFERTCF